MFINKLVKYKKKLLYKLSLLMSLDNTFERENSIAPEISLWYGF